MHKYLAILIKIIITENSKSLDRNNYFVTHIIRITDFEKFLKLLSRHFCHLLRKY